MSGIDVTGPSSIDVLEELHVLHLSLLNPDVHHKPVLCVEEVELAGISTRGHPFCLVKDFQKWRSKYFTCRSCRVTPQRTPTWSWALIVVRGGRSPVKPKLNVTQWRRVPGPGAAKVVSPRLFRLAEFLHYYFVSHFGLEVPEDPKVNQLPDIGLLLKLDAHFLMWRRDPFEDRKTMKRYVLKRWSEGKRLIDDVLATVNKK